MSVKCAKNNNKRLRYPGNDEDLFTIHTIISTETMLKSLNMAKPILIIEGKTDCRALTNIVDLKKCELCWIDKESGRDKEGWEGVIELLKRANERKIDIIIGIIDSDFDKILLMHKKHPTRIPLEINHCCFHTDLHDIETMILASSAYQKCLQKCGLSVKFESGIFDKILEEAVELSQQIGFVRCYNEYRKIQYKPLGLNFKKIYSNHCEPAGFINFEAGKIDYQALIKALKPDMSKEKIIEICEEISKYSETIRKNYSEDDLRWQICQGHDLVYFIYIIIRKRCKHPLRLDEFNQQLYRNYGIGEFLETGKNLHQKIEGWERKCKKENKQYQILKNVSE